MKRATNIALAVQVVLALLWVVPASMMDRSAGLGLLALLFYYVIASALPALFALWLLWRHPLQRGKAAVIVLLPILCVFLPTLLQGVIGGPVAARDLNLLVIALLTVLALVSIVAPRRIATVLPAFLFRSRLLNGLIVAGLVLAWVFLVSSVLWVLSDASNNGYRRDTGTGIAVALVLVMIYVLSLAAASLLVASWANLGLRSGVDGSCRKFFFSQLLVAVPGILTGIVAAVIWLGQR